MRSTIVLLALTLVPGAAVSDGTVRQLWQGDPIEVQLAVGVERRIVIEGAQEIRVGFPAELVGAFQAKSIGSSSWLQAAIPLDKTRILISAPPHLELIVAEVTAFPDIPPPSNMIIRLPDATDNLAATSRSSPGFASLTRWAIQQLYSPERLRTTLVNATSAPVGRQVIDIFRCGPVAPSACGGAVQATPIAAWRTGTHYITAVHLENLSPYSVVLDPRNLRGRWRTATFVNSRLSPAGQVHASTTLVLISDEPTAAALRR